MKSFICAILTCLLAACTNQEAQKENKQISAQIEQQLKSTHFTNLDLSKVSTKDWERVCYVGPYSTNESVKPRLGFDWNIEENTDIGANDSISLLLFIKKNNVVEFVQHPRNLGDFKFDCLSRQDAQFTVSKTGEWFTILSKNVSPERK